MNENIYNCNNVITQYGFAPNYPYYLNQIGVIPPACCACNGGFFCGFGASCVACDLTKITQTWLGVKANKANNNTSNTKPTTAPKPPANPYTPWIWGLTICGIGALGIVAFVHFRSKRKGGL